MESKFERFVGKVLINVEAEIQELCSKYGYSFSVLDRVFPMNIDVDRRGLNLLVNDEFVIRRIWLG